MAQVGCTLFKEASAFLGPVMQLTTHTAELLGLELLAQTHSASQSMPKITFLKGWKQNLSADTMLMKTSRVEQSN